jgi:hypothetical protein
MNNKSATARMLGFFGIYPQHLNNAQQRSLIEALVRDGRNKWSQKVRVIPGINLNYVFALNIPKDEQNRRFKQYLNQVNKTRSNRSSLLTKGLGRFGVAARQSLFGRSRKVGPEPPPNITVISVNNQLKLANKVRGGRHLRE